MNEFKSFHRKRQPDLIVLHESVTDSRETTIAVLKKRGLGVHYTVDRDGSVINHVPLDRYSYHAGSGRNTNSIAIEVINRYYGAYAKPGNTVISAVWAHKGRYIMPTQIQLESVWQLVLELGTQFNCLHFPGNDGAFHWGQIPRVYTGVSAHHRWAHADGLVPECYCRIRAIGCDPVYAYAYTLDTAQSASRDTLLPVSIRHGFSI